MRIDEYCKAIGFRPTQMQRQVLQAIHDGEDVLLQRGRGVGTSTLAIVVAGWFAIQKQEVNVIGIPTVLHSLREKLLPGFLSEHITIVPGDANEIVRLRTRGRAMSQTRMPLVCVCPASRTRVMAPLDRSELSHPDVLEGFADSMDEDEYNATVRGEWPKN